MPCWDHTKKIAQSVFMMDWVFSFYVKPHHKCLQRGFQTFWTVCARYCHLSKESPLWRANGHKSAANVPLKIIVHLQYYDISF